jgi:hypothetical protein
MFAGFMLLAYQLPVCDLRRFVPNADLHPVGPAWPTPTPGEEFLRSFGPVARRRRGGHEQFPDEVFYADAAGAVRFSHLERQELGGEAVRPAVAYRRLLCTGEDTGAAVVRLELGFSSDRRPSPVLRRPHLTGRDSVNVALDLLELPVVLSSRSKYRRPSSLWTMGKPFGEVYARATTAVDEEVPETARKLIQPCPPLLMFEYDEGEIESLPPGTRAVDPGRIGGLSLSFIWIEYRSRQFGLWFLRRDPGDTALCRRLRIGLFRVHAEHQVLRRALSSLRSGVFEYERGTDESDLFDSYLASATRVLGRDERGGFSHGAIREVIAAYNAVVNSSELALLEERLALVRRQIGARVTRYSTPGADSPAGLPEVQKEAGDTIRVFVSYSHGDKEHVEAADKYSLLSYLRGLEKNRFRFWSDTLLQGGDDWDARIKDEIDAADIALVLVSQAYLNSRYCVDDEVARFLQARKDRGLVVYPVILSPCDWQSYPWLTTTQWLPGQNETVATDYTDHGKRMGLYLKILEQLRAIGGRILVERH